MTKPSLVSSWSTTGTVTNLQSTLSDIRAKHKDDPESCLQNCLTLWLSKADKVTESGGPTWDSLADALHKIGENFAAEKIMEFSEKFNHGYFMTTYLLFSPLLIEFSTPACQMLHKHTDRLTSLTLSVEIVQMLHAERVISKETLDEVNRSGGVLEDGPLKALCTTRAKKIKKFAIGIRRSSTDCSRHTSGV